MEFVFLNVDTRTSSRLRAQILIRKRRESEENECPLRRER